MSKMGVKHRSLKGLNNVLVKQIKDVQLDKLKGSRKRLLPQQQR
jgi:hypothetical protein